MGVFDFREYVYLSNIVFVTFLYLGHDDGKPVF